MTARVMNNKMMVNSQTMNMNNVLTSTRTTSCSGRSSNEQLWGIFYQGLKAGKKLKSASKGWKKPTGRGRVGNGRPPSSSSSNVTQVKKEKTGKCLDCGQFGHWKGDAECSRVKFGQRPLFKKNAPTSCTSPSTTTTTMPKREPR